jgi:hypothetical protein
VLMANMWQPLLSESVGITAVRGPSMPCSVERFRRPLYRWVAVMAVEAYNRRRLTTTRLPASTERQALRTSVQLQSTNAQTPRKTEEHQTPESKTNQQDREPDEICKTSIPGSNPGGASKISNKIANRAPARDWRPPVLFPNRRRDERKY